MKVYRIQLDVNLYQIMLPRDESIWSSDMLLCDCQRKKDSWQPPELYVFNPKLRKGNFFNLAPGSFICDEKAYDVLGEYLEMAGELLPFSLEGTTYYLFNVLECTNSLEPNLTEWQIASNGSRMGVRKYAFYKNSFSESSIFKIPETSRSEILTYSDLKDEEDEFIYQYNHSGLEGLLFEELWPS